MSEAEDDFIPQNMPGGDFRLFLQKLRIQGFMVMGLLDNPRFKDVPVNLPPRPAP